MVKNCQSFATNILLKKVIHFGNFGQKSLKLETLYENNFKSCSEKPQKKEKLCIAMSETGEGDIQIKIYSGVEDFCSKEKDR